MLATEFKYPISEKRIPGPTAYPEIQLMSLIVLATKLIHPFDDVTRIPESELDPGTVKVDWKSWWDIMSGAVESGLKRGEEINVTDEVVMAMDGKQIDHYLDWYQRTWIDDRDLKGLFAEF